jgi:AcrR family transcriptional regulator
MRDIVKPVEDARKTKTVSLTVQERRERHRETLRSDLIEAARQLVQEEGYDGLTIRKLAKRVGYAPMSVYSYFADKQDILLALAEDRFALLARRIEENTSDDPIEALRAVMRPSGWAIRTSTASSS